MDVSRGDRVLWEGEECAVIVAEPDGLNEVVLKRERDDCYYTAYLDDLSPAPPDVVTPPDYSFGEALEYRTSVGPWLPAKWVGFDPVNEGMGVLRNDSDKGANVVTVGLHDIRRPLPDVVTLTLRYKGHEVSVDAEAESIPAWKDFGGGSLTQLAAAARALAEKVDGGES